MIDKKDYEAFVWIKDNVDDNYQKAILDPWKATAFTVITGKNVFTRLQQAPIPNTYRAREFLSNGCEDTDFLNNYGISIVYTSGNCNNPNLIEVSSNIYLLKNAITR
jgi:hypothetical protein